MGYTSLRFHLTLGIKQHERSPTLQLIDLVVTFADVPEALAVLYTSLRCGYSTALRRICSPQSLCVHAAINGKVY